MQGVIICFIAFVMKYFFFKTTFGNKSIYGAC